MLLFVYCTNRQKEGALSNARSALRIFILVFQTEYQNLQPRLFSMSRVKISLLINLQL